MYMFMKPIVSAHIQLSTYYNDTDFFFLHFITKNWVLSSNTNNKKVHLNLAVHDLPTWIEYLIFQIITDFKVLR